MPREVYKVVWKYEDRFISAIVGCILEDTHYHRRWAEELGMTEEALRTLLIRTAIIYKPGTLVKAHPKSPGIFCFKNYSSATEFARSLSNSRSKGPLAIWKGIGKYPRRLPEMFSCNVLDIANHYWLKRKKWTIKSYGDHLPYGTLLFGHLEILKP